MTPSISVIIPLFNHEKYIAKTVDSVLQQTHANFELIIIDDGSSDSSRSIVSTISDNRLRFFTQENRGAHATINRGIELATGDYITILNSDDIYYPDRLQIFIDILTQSPEIDALFSRVEAINDDDSHYLLFPNAPKHHIPLERTVPQRRLAVDLLGINIVTTTSNIICKKEVFDEIGTFNNYRYCHDLDFFLRLFNKKNVQFVNTPLLKYRCHETNTLKENAALVHFESAIVLFDFLRANTPEDLFPGLSQPQAMAHFFSILVNHRIDRLFYVLSQFDQWGTSWEAVKEELLMNTDHPLRITCLHYINDCLVEDKERKARNIAKQQKLTANKTTPRKVLSFYKKFFNKVSRYFT